ncbi:MAG: phage portal protein [Alphaproteobacteria bacterium]|nr:phage portal protein [Alphaproteobacteria bacterium]
MRLFGKPRPGRGEAKSATPLVAISDLRAAQWSNASALVREGFERNAVGYRCVRMISEAAASVGFRAAGSGEAAGALARLMSRPNRDQAGPDLMECFYGHLAVAGDAFLEASSLDGEVRELHVLRPDRMAPVKGPRGYPLAWDHRVGSDTRRISRGADGFLPVLHLRLFHPSDDYQGHAPLEAAARAVDVHNGGGAWAKALIDNAARPSGALIYTGAEAMTEEQVNELKADLERSHSGASNAGRPLLLQGGLDWRPMSLSPAEMDFIAARHAAAREIALAFGVPPMLLGIPGDATYSNYREANSAFWRMTVLPLVNRAARAVSGWLGARVGGEIAPDLDAVPAFAEERAALWARIDAAGFLTLEEKRRLAGV